MLPIIFWSGPVPTCFLDLHADGFEVQAHLLEHVDGDALAQLDQAEQKMFGADDSCG